MGFGPTISSATTLFVVLNIYNGFMSASLLLLNLGEVRVEMLDSTFLGGEETRQVWDGVTAVGELFLRQTSVHNWGFSFCQSSLCEHLMKPTRLQGSN